MENKNLVQATARLRYDVQCCGFTVEMIQSDYNVDKERQFRFSIQLANIGSIGSFGGQDAVAAPGLPGRTMSTRILVTGGAGFIGSNFVRHVARTRPDWEIVVLDKLTYAGRRENLAEVEGHAGFSFVQGDIADPEVVARVLPGCHYVVNFAAETHVDRSLYDAGSFIQTDVYGAFVLLEEARRADGAEAVRADLDGRGLRQRAPAGSSQETDALMPRNPYSASKAGGDRLAYSYFATYGVPVIVTRASNNYGPYQFPEKVIPLFVTHAIDDIPVPLYGDGLNVRDWLHVDDHCRAVDFLLERGRPGETYNVGGGNEVPNIDLTRRILVPGRQAGEPDPARWPTAPATTAATASTAPSCAPWAGSPRCRSRSGLAGTVDWYREHEGWWRPLKEADPAFREHYQRHYGGR